MAEKKKSKALATKGKATKGATKKSLKGALGDKTNKILARQKVSSSGLSGHKKAKFNVAVVMRQVKEVVGFLAEVTDFDITIKGRPVVGKGRKDHFNVLHSSDVVSYEGTKGSACRALVQIPTTVADYKNCTYFRKSNGTIELTTEGGETVTLNPAEGIDFQIAAVID